MINNQKYKVQPQFITPQNRINSFDEVCVGYTYDEAVAEASRCLNCKNASCITGCPVGVNIPKFIKYIADNNVEDAYYTIKVNNYLPAICGRVCPQESQCESKCIKGKTGDSVAIGLLERFCADWARNNIENNIDRDTELSGKKVGIVGSGPASLTCAAFLANKGAAVDIFESLHVAGGVLQYGIPNFRLPKEVVDYEINTIKHLGVNIHTDTVIGKTLTINQLTDEYDAVFIGTGAGLPNFMNIDGEGLSGVYSANEYLTRANLMKCYDTKYDTIAPVGEKVVVVGGGNVAMDAARVAKRLGHSVTIVYRRSEQEMPARLREIAHAKEENITFSTLTNPVKILGDDNGHVQGIECVKMQLLERDDTGRRAVKAVENSNHIIDADCVIMAIGTSPNPLLKNSVKDLVVDKRGCIVVDSDMKTNIDKIWAGGDAISGSATVIKAMSAGKTAATSIANYLTSVNKE